MMLQRNPALAPELARQEEYWRNTLGDELPVLRLCADHGRPPVCSFLRAIEQIDLASAICREIRNLCERRNVTVFVMLLAAFKTLLFRHTGVDDVIVGSVSSDSAAGAEKEPARFANPVALRTSLKGDPTFAQLLKRVDDIVEAASINRDWPFERIVEGAHGESGSGDLSLFHVMFVATDAVSSLLSAGPVTEENLASVGEHVAGCELVFLVAEQEESFTVTCEYDAELFEPATINRFLWHYAVLLAGITASEDRRISRLPILTEAEKHQLLVEWNDTDRNYPSERCVHQLFEEQVEKTPDVIALQHDGHTLTYRELNRRANQLAHYLIELGVGTEVRVGVFMERSLDMVVAVLAILKGGAACVPLDPAYPTERLSFMLADTQAGIILTDGSWLARVPPADAVHVICLDRDREEIAARTEHNPSSQSTAGNLAYVLYTSGSTGVPKGVGVPHRGVARLLFGVDYARLDGTQTFLHMAPISFDGAIFELWGALLHGGSCVLWPGKVPGPGELEKVLKEHRVSTLWLTAALFNAVIEQEPQAFAELKQLLIGGEALSVRHVRKGLALLPGTEIINGYGPTESTTFACCYSVPRELHDNLSSIPIGKPIGNTQVYILDPHLNPAPIGVVGELYIGGDGLARGYLDRPDLTAEKFLPNPFSAKPGGSLYRTGDLARYLPDGNIEFLGRIDHQVKLRGFRIELGEIEAVLAGYHGVADAVVLAKEDAAGHKQLNACIVAKKEDAPATRDLRAYLARKLPDFMIPSAFLFFDSLPLLPNGKVNRKALSASDHAGLELKREYVAPRTSLEKALAEIFAEVLNLARPGIDDNFFELGGDSLSATQVIARLRDAMQIKLPLRCLFETPSVAELAKSIEGSAQQTGQKAFPVP